MQTVLIVDDNAFWREAASLYLQAEGFDVQAAEDGREALQVLAQGPLPGVVLLDAAMPDMDGASFLARVRGDPRLKRLPVVVCSGRNEPLEGADAFLSKQADPVELLQTVCELMVPSYGPGAHAAPGQPRDVRHVSPAVARH
jgi:CheY-like chemotaxis protein